jgi:hypothetical protein
LKTIGKIGTGSAGGVCFIAGAVASLESGKPMPTLFPLAVGRGKRTKRLEQNARRGLVKRRGA